MDVDKAKLGHIPCIIGRFRPKRPAELLARLEQTRPPRLPRRARSRPIVTPGRRAGVLHLQPPAGLQSVEGTSEHLPHVLEAHRQHAPMYVVEAVVQRPLLLGVAHRERHVRRHVRALHGAQVGADDARGRIRSGEVDGPEASPGAQVQRGVQAAGVERRAVQGAIEGEAEEVVLQVEAVLLAVVVGEHVLAVAEAVVEPAVLFDGATDRVSETAAWATWRASRTREWRRWRSPGRKQSRRGCLTPGNAC